MKWLIHGIGKVRSIRACFLVIALVLFTSPRVCAFCFEEAGQRYGLSPRLLWAIAKTESCFNPSAVHYNKDGSFDYGLMQVNSSWYSTLGHERWMRLGDACYNVQVGAWILSRCVQRYGYTWKAVGCYNAFSKEKRAVYANRVYRVLEEAARRAADCSKGDLAVSFRKKKKLGPDRRPAR
jgi:soluble lytic murein transglycosylase-like protein